MLVALASHNRAKVAATEVVARRVFPAAEVRPVVVTVTVPAQPLGDEQTQVGAIARARAARAVAGADVGIGLEGGLRSTRVGWALCSWAAVVASTEQVGLGGGGILLLPRMVVERVVGGEELGPVMDELAQATETHHGQGASGILTGGLLNRHRIFEDVLIGALVPWLHPSFGNRQLFPNENLAAKMGTWSGAGWGSW